MGDSLTTTSLDYIIPLVWQREYTKALEKAVLYYQYNKIPTRKKIVPIKEIEI